MILGMTTSAFTLLHVLISVAGILSGFVVVYGLLSARRLDRWTAIFLITTVLASVTGFLFPNKELTPGQIVGGISLVVLAVGVAARYVLHLAGVWRWIYVVSAVTALYFNCFVAVVQAFEKNPVLRASAPTQKELPFLVAQIVVLALFMVIGVLGVKRFRVGATA